LLRSEVVFVVDICKSLVLLVLEPILLFLHMLYAAAFLHAYLVQLLCLLSGLFDRTLVLRRADDVLEILEQTIVVLGRSLGLHLRNRLDLTLQNEEALVIQIYASIFEQRCDSREVRGPSVDIVFATVVLECPS